MAKKKISRKAFLKRPDEFITISSRVAELARTHQQQLNYIGVAIAVIIIAYFAFRTWTGSVNEEGQTAYNTAAQSLLTGSIKPDADPSVLKKSEESFMDVVDNQKMSKAARLALPQAAYIQFLEKNYAESITLYHKFSDKVAGDTRYESLTGMAMAACYEAKGDLKTAIETLTHLMETSSNRPFRESVIWSLARLYRLDNSPDKAEEVLKEFVEKYKDSPFYAMAKARLEITTN